MLGMSRMAWVGSTVVGYWLPRPDTWQPKSSKARPGRHEHVATWEQGWSLARGGRINASLRPTLCLGQDDSVTMG